MGWAPIRWNNKKCRVLGKGRLAGVRGWAEYVQTMGSTQGQPADGATEETPATRQTTRPGLWIRALGWRCGTGKERGFLLGLLPGVGPMDSCMDWCRPLVVAQPTGTTVIWVDDIAPFPLWREDKAVPGGIGPYFSVGFPALCGYQQPYVRRHRADQWAGGPGRWRPYR